MTASTSGDTVRIAAGTYPESVNADTKTLTFEGAGSATLIEPAAAPTGQPALSIRLVPSSVSEKSPGETNRTASPR